MHAYRNHYGKVILKKDDRVIGEYNLHYHTHLSDLQERVGKQVFDLISLHSEKWIDCRSLEVEG